MIEHGTKHEEGELGGRPQRDEAGGHESVGLAAQTQQHGQQHHQADRQDGMIARQIGDHLLRDHLPREGGQQRPENQEDRDVDEVVQGGIGDVAEALPRRAFCLRGVIVRRSADSLLGMARGMSSLLPYLRYCHSTMCAVHDRDEKAQANAQTHHPPAAHLIGQSAAGSTAFSMPEKATKVLSMTTTLMIGPASR